MAQVVELHAALERIKEDSGRWNKSLAMLRRKQEEAARLARKGLGDSPGDGSPPKVAHKEKGARRRSI